MPSASPPALAPSRRVALLGVWLLVAAGSASAQRCLAVEDLPADRHGDARHLLLAIADGEDLYTLSGGLKPMSSGGWSLTVPLVGPTVRAHLDSVDRVRALLPALRCGAVEAAVYIHPPVADDSSRRATASLYTTDREALARAIAANRAVFDSIGVTPATPFAEVLALVDRAPRATRWRAYGILFGYPLDAVEFFVRAGIAGDSIAAARGVAQFVVPRDFRRIATVRQFPARDGDRPTLSRFVYAVPKDSPETPLQQAVREAAAPVFASYIALRADYLARGDTLGLLRAILLHR